VRTSVGIDRIHVLFDDAEWLGFPVTATFAQGDTVITQAIEVSSAHGSDDWMAEAECVIPFEAMMKVGPVRITFQGTDSSGNHIITAKGAPLYVEEAGDVAMGDIPSDAPPIDQWQQAYANAVAAANRAASAAAELESRMASIVSEAEAEISEMIGGSIGPATYDDAGVVKIGSGLEVSADGRIDVSSV
jgi:hypothetical protein